MPAQTVIERSFAGGEIAPALYSRVDQSKYTTGLRTARNQICMRHGGVTQRPGTMYVGTTLNGGNPVRLIPFIFNETGLGQSYILEFGNEYIAFYQNGGVVISAPNTPYTIASPYLQADLEALQFDQTGDILTIAHQNYPPAELVRNAPTSWALNNIVFGVPPSNGANTINPSGGGSGTSNYSWLVTSVDLNGNESPATGFTGEAVNINPPSASNPVSITWNGPAGIAISQVAFWNIYRANWVGSAFSTYGYVGTVPPLPKSFIDTIGIADFSNTPPQTSPFESLMGTGYYPGTVAFIQQRRGFANWLKNPIGFALSRSGAFSNFDIHTGASSPDDDPVFGSIAGGEINVIQHLVELKFMLMLTAGAEIFVQGNGSGVVTPTAINASAQSQYGASPLRALKVGDVVLFNQALGSFIRDFVFDFVIDGYRGNDITVFSAHLFEGHQIVDWAYQKVPDSIIWAVREDGVLLSCTYIREQQILAWTRHDFTNGFVENVCAIPENGEYAVYVVIRRIFNGSTVRYIERVSSRIWSDPLTATYVDCFASYDGRNTSIVHMTLKVADGISPFQTGPTAYQQSLAIKSTNSIGADQPYFNSGMVGQEIFIQDAEFVSSQGVYGNQVRCVIQTYVDSSDVLVTVNRAVPTEFQDVMTTNWSQAVRTVTGLSYLEGQQVSVWADRFVVGSPLNKQVSKVYTVSGGSITLDKCYAVIYVGLPMVMDFETLQIDTSFGESIQDQPKNISRVIVYLYNARGFFGGTQNPDTDPDNLVNGVVQDSLYNLIENKAQGDRLTYDAPPGVLTDSQFVNVPCNWSKEGRIFIRNVDPIPLAILAVIPAGLTAAKIPYSQRV